MIIELGDAIESVGNLPQFEYGIFQTELAIPQPVEIERSSLNHGFVGGISHVSDITEEPHRWSLRFIRRPLLWWYNPPVI